MENEKPTAVDPGNSKRVRFTDNSAKEGDFYPEDQSPEPIALDPAGSPYSQVVELGGYMLGQNAVTDGEARVASETAEGAGDDQEQQDDQG